MPLRIFPKWPLIIIGIAGVISFLAFDPSARNSRQFLTSVHNVALGGEVIQSPLLLAETNPALPTRLKIPSINVDAPIDQMGITPEGAMESPSGPKNAGWFKFGTVPGDTGSAVIAGHYGWKNGIPALFDDLRVLQEGDKIYVEDDAGAVLEFVVRELRTYNKDELASEVFSSEDGKAHLNLVTCGGTYDKQAKSYSERLVVFADLRQ